MKKFTLINATIVMAIIGILALYTDLKKSRYKARLAVCAENMRQNSLALYSYADDNDHYWPQRTRQVLHYLEYKSDRRVSVGRLFYP